MFKQRERITCRKREKERNNTYKDGCEDEYENCIKKNLFDIDSL